MILTSPPQNASLAPYLHARAIAASPLRLSLDIVVGVAAAGVAFWLRPFGWMTLVFAGLTFASYGAWAFAERRLESEGDDVEHPGDWAWNLLRSMAALTGFAAAMATSFTFLAVMFGGWIS